MPAADNTVAHIRSLQDLPVEILHRILIHGSAESTLALCKVNRKLRSICYDPLVFLHIIREDTRTGSSRNKQWTKRLDLDHETDAGVLAKWALADSKARGVCLINTANVLRWLPQLQIAGGYSSTRSAMVQSKLMSRNQDAALIMKTTFCWTCACLEDPNWCIKTKAVESNLFQSRIAANAWECARPFEPLVGYNAKEGIHAFFNTKLPFSGRTTDDPAWWRLQIHANIAVAMLSQHAHTLLGLNQIGWTVPGSHTNLAPPKSSQIPLASMIDLQAPFTTFPSHGTFNTAHLNSMTRPEFIEDEPWIGYYCYSMGDSNPNVQIDAMMSDITIKCVARDVANTELEGHGVDGCGTFEIRGVLHRATGLTTLTKRYQAGTSWRWDAVMTPFGIVGCWGSAHWGGWFWLYKKSWSSTAEA